MDSTGTKADEANTSGATTGNAAAWAASGSRTARPRVAKTHDRAQPNRRTRVMPATKANAFVCTRNPTAKPTELISTATNTFRARSAVVRPARTADRAMGR